MSTTIQPGKVYSLFNASGKIEEIKKIDSLPLYCKVYCYGYGMDGREAAVIGKADNYGNYPVVYLSDYEPGFSQLDKYSRPHSAKFGIGKYYDDDLQTHDEQTVKEYILKAEKATKERKEAEEAKRQADEKEVKELPAKYPHLTPDPQDKKSRKANLVSHLKKHFPGVKFSVTNPHYDTINIDWTDGPTVAEVSKISGMFESYSNDFTGDYRDYTPSNFNRVFGGFKYIFENRDRSEAVNALLPQLEELRRDSRDQDGSNLLYQIHYDTSLPVGAVITGIERTEITCGDLREFYRITYTTPDAPQTEEKKAENKPTTPAPASTIQVVEYGKGLAVIGDFSAYYDQLIKIGGKYNPRLKCGRGIVFSPSKLEAIKAVLMADQTEAAQPQAEAVNEPAATQTEATATEEVKDWRRHPELEHMHPLNICDPKSSQYKEALKEYEAEKASEEPTPANESGQTQTGSQTVTAESETSQEAGTLRDEIEKTVQFFVDQDLQHYGHIRPQTEQIAKVQRVHIQQPEPRQINLFLV